MRGRVAVALLNRSETKTSIKFSLDSVSIDAKKGYTMKDVWSGKTYALSNQEEQSLPVEPHGIVVLVLSGVSRPYNIFQGK
jgi:hypothetical protein